MCENVVFYSFLLRLITKEFGLVGSGGRGWEWGKWMVASKAVIKYYICVKKDEYTCIKLNFCFSFILPFNMPGNHSFFEMSSLVCSHGGSLATVWYTPWCACSCSTLSPASSWPTPISGISSHCWLQWQRIVFPREFSRKIDGADQRNHEIYDKNPSMSSS